MESAALLFGPCCILAAREHACNWNQIQHILLAVVVTPAQNSCAVEIAAE